MDLASLEIQRRQASLQHQLSALYNAVLRFLPRRLNGHSHLASDDLSSSNNKGREGLIVVSPETSADKDP